MEAVLRLTRLPGSREVVCLLKWGAARMVQVEDHIIIMSYCDLTPEEAFGHKPKVVFVDDKNQIKRVSSYEKHGQLSD